MRPHSLLLPALVLGLFAVVPLQAQTSRVVVQVRDAESGQAVPRVKVRFPGRGLEGTTAATGIAMFAAVDTGTHVLELEHPQRGKYTHQVRVGPQKEMGLEMRIPLQYLLEGLVVTARTPRELERRARAIRRDIIVREDIQEVLGSKRNVGELLQGRMPGVRVFEGTFADEETGMRPSRRICIQMTRRQQQVSKRRQCSMIAVYVDGTRISDPGSYLLSLPLSALESVEVLGPMTAATRYGTNAGFGVLEIYTRGNGPNVSR